MFLCPYFYLSPCVSVSPCLCLCLSTCWCVLLSLFVCISVSPFRCLCLCLGLSVSLNLCLVVSMSLSIFPSPTVCVMILPLLFHRGYLATLLQHHDGSSHVESGSFRLQHSCAPGSWLRPQWHLIVSDSQAAQSPAEWWSLLLSVSIDGWAASIAQFFVRAQRDQRDFCTTGQQL